MLPPMAVTSSDTELRQWLVDYLFDSVESASAGSESGL